jgi:hypothetical protein
MGVLRRIHGRTGLLPSSDTPSEYFPELLSLQPDETRLWSPFASEAQFERFSSLWLQRYEEVKTALCAEVDRLDDAAAYAPEIMDLAGAIAALTAEQRAELGDAPVPSLRRSGPSGSCLPLKPGQRNGRRRETAKPPSCWTPLCNASSP